ncbi:DUF262 domain-containing protein [Bullifex porci]|nr:DUF262 domain-containing protein [Bullifex porci]
MNKGIIKKVMAYNAFCKDEYEYEYTIPIFQRGYAWGKDEIECLLEDILNSKGEYFIGTVIVEEKGNNLYIIDGQQRLTTLYLLLCLIRDDKSSLENKLRFEARDNAQGILESLSTSSANNTEDEKDSSSANITLKEKDSSLIYGIEIIKAWIDYNKIDKNKFIDKLTKTFFLLVSIPAGTNPNQFFETMNNRGEQLELHELVKAKILETMKDSIEEKERTVASEIWDAIANMNGFVVNHFSDGIKQKLFGDKNERKVPSSFTDIMSIYASNEKALNQSSLKVFLDNNVITAVSTKEEEKDISEELKSIITFPTFLMLSAPVRCHTHSWVKLPI